MQKIFTLKELINFYHGLKAVSEIDSKNFSFTFAVAKNLNKISREVEPVLESATKRNTQIINQYGKKNEDGLLEKTEQGYLIAPENIVAYTAAIEELNAELDGLLKTEVEMDVHQVENDEKLFPDMKPAIFMAILPMVKD